MTPQELEGQYFLFEYSASYTVGHGEDGYALTLDQVKEGKLEEIIHPCDIINPLFGNAIGEHENLAVIDFMKKKGIKVVYSTQSNPPNPFFGKSMEHGDNKETWCSYEGLFGVFGNTDDWVERLKREGIELRKYNPD